MTDSPTPARPLARVWLVVNAGSGSTDAAVIEGLTVALGTRGVAVAGTTDFPEQALPDAARLRAADADTLLICGGDGTINAAWSAADDWEGQCVVLPGGTMNGLAKALHGDNGRDAILDAVATATLVNPPTASTGVYHALVGVILGPAASWVRAREGVRKGRFIRAMRAARLAWARSFGRTIRVARTAGKHRAVIVTPGETGLEVATISADGVTDAIRLGWQWLLGDWRTAPGVAVTTTDSVTLLGHRKVRALFDGEPAMLPSPAVVRFGRTRLKFVRTKPA
ncbi:diacylglycerol/lipid kinase family protein [Glacieibacterium frigidum]|nr:diacylglycerol kinase family protein [Glacieibacterium frigidum]